MAENSKSIDGLRNRRPTTAAIDSDRAGNCHGVPESVQDNRDVDAVAVSASRPRNTNGDAIPNRRINRRFTIYLLYFLHAAAIACFVSGIVLRTSRLHNGDECDMTYSMRMFLEVETPVREESEATPVASKYRVYKFVDQRDPRYQQILRQQQQQTRNPLGRKDHCRNSSKNIVVYVPGHWGTYDQARSLGAHGLGLTRARESSRIVRETQQKILASATSTIGNNNNNSSNSDSAEDFVYDVYALDFAEQGGGLHGEFLRHQSDFLAAVLEQLSEDCGLSGGGGGQGERNSKKTLVVVAHSMGGYVARRVLLQHPELRVDNLVTLATPHENPLYAFDRSVVDFHRELLEWGGANATTSTNLVVSISGGLRDEMIEASACAIERNPVAVSGRGYFSSRFLPLWKRGGDNGHAVTPNSWTILATKLVAKANSESAAAGATTSNGETLLGMDHRAIVWCHQLLEEVRKVLWVLMTSKDNTAQERLDRVKDALGAGNAMGVGEIGTLEYSTNLVEAKRGLVKKFGSLHAVCMESSMIYNLPYLQALYALQVAFRCARATRTTDPMTSVLPVWASILLGWIFRSDLHWVATIIMALVANSFNLALLKIAPVGFLQQRRERQMKAERPMRTVFGVMFRALAVIFVILLGALVVSCCLGAFVVHSWFGLMDSAMYVYDVASIYAMLIVWMGFMDKHRNETTSDSNNDNNDIQLNTFAIMVAPFLFAGPLVLMTWEQQTRPSSWWTLFWFQFPVVILTSIKLSTTQMTTILRDSSGHAATAGGVWQLRKQHLKNRAIAIYLSVFFFLRCGEPGLLSRGAGYIVPNLAVALLWVEIALSLTTLWNGN